MPNEAHIITKRPVLQQTGVAVSHEGETVTLMVGEHPLRMQYETALDVAGWIRLAGKQGRNFQGDEYLGTRLIGSDEQHKVEVHYHAEFVLLKIGSSELRMIFDDALQVAGWLWEHARQAKAEMGDQSRRYRVQGDLTYKQI